MLTSPLHPSVVLEMLKFGDTYFYELTKLLNYCRTIKGIVNNEENVKRPDFLLYSILTVHLQILTSDSP
jgi:hypothetical protein